MRIFLYEILTQIIVWLGLARERLMIGGWMAERKDRTFYATTLEDAECCDCGLTHRARPIDGEDPRDPSHKLRPMRPVGYKYFLRFGSGKSSPFVDESSSR